MIISAKTMDFQELNLNIKATSGDIVINDCLGQRFIGAKLRGAKLTINGVPGNALGTYLDGGIIEVNGNAQDAVGDTMNDGKIVIHGSAGDALGYAMRGGTIYVRNNVGYRAGVHMKEYQDKKPVVVIGGSTGSFLGEYLAGGLIIVLGIGIECIPFKNFIGMGMHGGKIFVRTKKLAESLPPQVSGTAAENEDILEIEPYILEFSNLFGIAVELKKEDFFVLKPNAKNPYKKLYTAN